MTKKDKLSFAVFLPLLALCALFIGWGDGNIETEVGEVKTDVLNIVAIETVCHSGSQHRSIRWIKPNGEESWAIFSSSLSTSELEVESEDSTYSSAWSKKCDGSEAVHPHTRDKVLEEQEKEAES